MYPSIINIEIPIKTAVILRIPLINCEWVIFDSARELRIYFSMSSCPINFPLCENGLKDISVI